MTREQAKELLPIIQAFAEGKTIQFRERDIEVMLYSYDEERAFTYYDIDYNKDNNKLYLG